MKRSYRNWLFALIAIAVVSLIGFRVWSSWNQPERKTIVVLLPSRDNPFWAEIRKGVEAEKQQLGERYEVQIMASGEMDAADQVTQLRDALIRNVDGVVIGIADSRAPAPAIAQFNVKNIPVVLIDTKLDSDAAAAAGAKTNAFIGSDNRQGGELAADAISQALAGKPGVKRVLLIKGSYVHQSAIDRAEGFMKGARGRFEVIERDGEWSKQKAVELTSAAVAREPLAAIFASNDDMALGAVSALDNARLPAARRPLVVGFDATGEGRKAIAEGKMYASVGQQTDRIGREGVSRLVKLLEKRPVDVDELVPVKLVTKDAK